MHASTDPPQQYKPATSAPTPAVIRARTFPGHPESVREARAWAIGLVPASTAADVALMVSELVTNAILYTASGLSPSGQVLAEVQLVGDQVRVDIINQPGIVAGSSKGLGAGRQIVATLADECGFGDLRNWFILRPGGTA